MAFIYPFGAKARPSPNVKEFQDFKFLAEHSVQYLETIFGFRDNHLLNNLDFEIQEMLTRKHYLMYPPPSVGPLQYKEGTNYNEEKLADMSCMDPWDWYTVSEESPEYPEDGGPENARMNFRWVQQDCLSAIFYYYTFFEGDQ